MVVIQKRRKTFTLAADAMHDRGDEEGMLEATRALSNQKARGTYRPKEVTVETWRVFP